MDVRKVSVEVLLSNGVSQADAAEFMESPVEARIQKFAATASPSAQKTLTEQAAMRYSLRQKSKTSPGGSGSA